MRVRYAPANAKLARLAARLGVEVYSFDIFDGVRTAPSGLTVLRSYSRMRLR